MRESTYRLALLGRRRRNRLLSRWRVLLVKCLLVTLADAKLGEILFPVTFLQTL